KARRIAFEHYRFAVRGDAGGNARIRFSSRVGDYAGEGENEYGTGGGDDELGAGRDGQGRFGDVADRFGGGCFGFVSRGGGGVFAVGLAETGTDGSAGGAAFSGFAGGAGGGSDGGFQFDESGGTIESAGRGAIFFGSRPAGGAGKSV